MKDPVKLIKQDHRTLKSLFRRFDKATRKAERQKIAEEVIELLSVHATFEEELVYPLLRNRDPRLEAATLDALEEHHAVKLTLAELDKMKIEDERYPAKMHVVRESIEMHIEEEEAKLLPRLERLLEDDERTELADAIIAMKEAAPTHPHPLAPDEPPGNIVAGMLAKMSDASKDLIRKFTNSDKAEGHRRARRRIKAPSAAIIAKQKRASSGRRAAAH